MAACCARPTTGGPDRWPRQVAQVRAPVSKRWPRFAPRFWALTWVFISLRTADESPSLRGNFEHHVAADQGEDQIRRPGGQQGRKLAEIAHGLEQAGDDGVGDRNA